MKRITLLLLMITGIVSAQMKIVEKIPTIEIGKITPGGIKTIYCEKINNEYYIFHYKDAKFIHLDEWKSFKVSNDDDFNSLYGVVMDGFKNIPEENIMLESPNGFIWLDYKKVFGKPYVRFAFTTSKSEYATIGFSNQYNEKQVNRLFGK